MLRKEFWGLLILFCWLSGSAQENTAYFSIRWANDFFYLPAPTDHYYTNGLEIDLALPVFGRNPLNRTLLHSGKSALQLSGLKLTQDMFTPIQKDTVAVFPDDRPFASVLTLHSYRHSTTPERQLALYAEWQFGLLGPAAGGGLTQNFIHALTPRSEEVIGWRNEVRTDVVINYNLEVEKGLFWRKHIQAWAAARFRLGTLYTDLTPSLHARVGLFQNRFGHLRGWGPQPLRAFAYGGLSMRLVAYDATLRGGLLRVDHRYRRTLALEPLQEQWELGVEASYRSFGIRLGVRGEAAPFAGGRFHRWGYLTFRWRGNGGK